MTREEIQALLDKHSAQFRAAWRVMLDTEVGGGPIQTGAGVPLIVSYKDDHAVHLTEDGKATLSLVGWHQGPSEETVYYERWVDGLRVAHGYIDVLSRLLVQSG